MPTLNLKYLNVWSFLVKKKIQQIIIKMIDEKKDQHKEVLWIYFIVGKQSETNRSCVMLRE